MKIISLSVFLPFFFVGQLIYRLLFVPPAVFDLLPFDLSTCYLFSKTQATQSWTHTHTFSEALKLERDISMKHNVSKLNISEPYLGLEHLESSAEESLQYKNICQENEYNLNHSKHDFFFFINVIVSYCPHIFYIWNKSQNSLSSHWLVNNSSQ